MSTLHADLQLAWPGFTLAVQTSIALSGITAVFGPSGCGKSTFLRIVAGLETGAAGSLRLDDEVWQGPTRGRPLPAHERGVGLVFQDARLFAHLDVQGNLRYAQKRANQRANQRALKSSSAPDIGWEAVVQALDIGPLLPRGIHALSGGERQRVAIARTLLARPRLLLMDEPLAALDVRRKAEILPLIERLPAAFGIPVLYVTHELSELTRLAQQMLLLHAGRVAALGPLDDVLQRLDLPGVDPFEAGVLLRLRVLAHDTRWQLLTLDLTGQRMSVPVPASAWPAVGTDLRVRVRARDVALATQPQQGLSIRNQLQATLLQLQMTEASAQAEALLDVGGQRLRARLTRQAVSELGLREGQTVWALVKSVALEDTPAAAS
jgi:molybdate transport system ATP-binding protein